MNEIDKVRTIYKDLFQNGQGKPMTILRIMQDCNVDYKRAEELFEMVHKENV